MLFEHHIPLDIARTSAATTHNLYSYCFSDIADSGLTLQCASAVYDTSGTSIGTGGLAGAATRTEDSVLSKPPDEPEAATLSASKVMLSRGATMAS